MLGYLRRGGRAGQRPELGMFRRGFREGAASGADTCQRLSGRSRRAWRHGLRLVTLLSRHSFNVSLAAVFGVTLIAGLSALPHQAHANDLVPLSISLTKTASPTTYSAAGQVITYTYVVMNDEPGAGRWFRFNHSRRR